jgi:hypothetical protein
MKVDLINKQIEETDLNQYLVIQIADNSYALSILPIKEIVIAPMQPLCQIHLNL